MACINFSINPVPSAWLNVTPAPTASLAVEAEPQPALAVAHDERPSLSVATTGQSVLKVEPVQQIRFAIGEVCTVTRDTIVVLAASDGPLRTRDGGYILLNPETNP